MWQGKHGNIVCKEYDEDFAEALEAYTKLKVAGKRMVTLRCANVGFPPPDRVLHHEVKKYRIVTRNRKKYKKAYYEWVDLMPQYNSQGIWWCPYCIKFRRFEQSNEGNKVIMTCPVCGVTNYNWHVRRWNPQAKTIEYRSVRARSTNGSGRVRRRTR